MALVSGSLILALVLGGAGLWLTYSLVSIIASALAVIGGFAVFGLLLRWLDDERPVELFDHEVADNLSYAAVSIPAGFMAYRLFEQLAATLSIFVVFLVVAVVVAVFLIGPVTLLGYMLSIMELMATGDEQ